MAVIENFKKIAIYNDGFVYGVEPVPRPGAKCSSVDSAKRGKVKGFSNKSARRLREVLLKYEVPGSKRVAITYTLPCQISRIEWALLVKRWRQNLVRKDLACIWRIELQRRQVPHLHVVAYVKDFEEVGDFWLAWVSACDTIYEGDFPLTVHDGFLVYGFLAKWIFGSKWFAYLAAHTVKHKNEQLGWQGRQWGIVNKARFRLVEPLEFCLTPYVAIRLARIVRRRYHYDSFTVSIFGSRIFFGLQRLHEMIQYYSLEETQREKDS